MFKKIKNFAVRRWKLLVFVAIVIAGVIFFISRRNSKEVKTATIQKGRIAEELFLSGEVTAKHYAKLSFETAGKISFVGVTEGDKVAKGKILSKLDTTVLNANYQIALANLRAMEATVANIHDQVKDHSGDETFAQKDLRTTAEVNKDKAYEAMIAAKRNLDGASLVAPFAGYVTYLAHSYSGVYTTPTAAEVELIDPLTMYFDVSADQTEVTKLSVGQKVVVVLDSFDDKEFDGVVDTISFTPKIGETGSVYSVKVKFTNTDLLNSRFKIVMSGEGKFTISEKDNVLFVPSGFVKQDKDGSYVKTSTKDRVYIETGIESEDNTEIKGSISEGQTVFD